MLYLSFILQNIVLLLNGEHTFMVKGIYVTSFLEGVPESYPAVNCVMNPFEQDR